MNEKDIWITTCGSFSNIKYRFWNKINSEKILDVDLIHSKGSDFIIKCITKDCKQESRLLRCSRFTLYKQFI